MSKTAPGFDRNLRWPISGQAYVAAFFGPISGGLFGGLYLPHSGAMGIGFIAGVGLSALNAILSDRYIDPWIARNYRILQPIVPRILANLAAFAWALLLSAAAMLVPVAVFGRTLLTDIF